MSADTSKSPETKSQGGGLKTDQPTVTFSLNGKEVTVPKGWTVMQAARREDVYIPHFCWHPGLSIAGVCRFCMVQVEGRPKLEIACNLTATDGMKVNTATEETKDAHKWALEFHLVNHPLDCPICDQAGECKLQDYYMEVGKYKSQMDRPKVLKLKALDVGDDLVLDTERCILCSRCVRFEEEVTKTDALGIFNRGDRSIIGTYPDKRIDHNYQTNLVDICPVGAFTSKDFRFRQRVWFLKDAPSVCPGCSTGCHVDVYAKPETRTYYRLKPRESEVNGHWMCDVGRDMYAHLNQERRLRKAVTTSGGKRQLAPVMTALNDLAEKIRATKPEKTAMLVSAQYTNEEYASLLQFFVKDLGVQNILKWRDPSEKRDAFDGILLRGDRNSNTLGLSAALKAVGLSDAVQDEFDAVARLNPELVIAIAPEIGASMPALSDRLAKLEELPFVSLWTVEDFARKHQGIASAIPLKGFAEKTGTIISHGGRTQTLPAAFAAGSDDAVSITEAVAVLSDLIGAGA